MKTAAIYVEGQTGHPPFEFVDGCDATEVSPAPRLHRRLDAVLLGGHGSRGQRAVGLLAGNDENRRPRLQQAGVGGSIADNRDAGWYGHFGLAALVVDL